MSYCYLWYTVVCSVVKRIYVIMSKISFHFVYLCFMYVTAPSCLMGKRHSFFFSPLSLIVFSRESSQFPPHLAIYFVIYLASPDGSVVWGVVVSTRWWLLVDHCVLRNWGRILVRAVKGLISRAGMVSICPLLWQRDVKLQQTKLCYLFKHLFGHCSLFSQEL